MGISRFLLDHYSQNKEGPELSFRSHWSPGVSCPCLCTCGSSSSSVFDQAVESSCCQCLKHFPCPGRNWQQGKAQRAQWDEQGHIPPVCQAPHVPPVCQAPHIPQALPGQPHNPNRLQSSMRGTPESTPGTGSHKGVWKDLSFPLAVRFCVTAQRKATQNYILSWLFIPRPSPSAAHAPLSLQTQEPPHWSQQDSPGASSQACICLDPVDIYRGLLLNWLLIIPPVSEGCSLLHLWTAGSAWLVSTWERWQKIANITFNIAGLFWLSCTALNGVFVVEREHKLWCRTLKDWENVSFEGVVWVLLSHLFILLDICRIIWSMSWNPSCFYQQQIKPLIGQ